MKTHSRIVNPLFLRLLLILACLAALGRPAFATVAFTITPAAVSNTYSGPLTLSVTGLTNGETVVVQKFLDVDGAGVIDASATLWQQFNLTDGGNFVIGGVTNNNVPDDTDGVANGQITAKLNLPADFSQLIPGTYLFELSSPLGHFPPLTNTFTITSFPYAQMFTGTVVSNGAPVPYAGVILLPSPNHNGPVGVAIANGAGKYVLPAPAGAYGLVAFKTNFVASEAGASGLVLSNGATLSTNLSLLPATETISGRIYDANTPSHGLPGLLGTVSSQTGLLGLFFTDTNGYFTAGVTANKWQIGGSGAALAFQGYLDPNNNPVVNATAGSVTGVNLGMTRATAFFYGTVHDIVGNPLPGVVAVEAYDNNNNLYDSDGYTDANGNFVVTAAGGLGSSDPWWVDVDNSRSFPQYLFSQPAFEVNGAINLTVGQAVLASISALPATNYITGTVKDNYGNPLVGVGVSASISVNNVNYQDSVDTDLNGNYSLAMANGTSYIDVNCQGGNDSLQNLGNYQCPSSQTIILAGSHGLANFIVQTNLNVDGNLQVVTTALPAVATTVAYDQQLTADGGQPSYSWSLYSGALPPGLSLDSGGTIQGIPTAGGTYNFVVQVSDNNSDSATASFSLTIIGALQITTTALSSGTTNVVYPVQQLAASGGQPPYVWSLASGALPPGLSLSTNGLISGTPATAGIYHFAVGVTDSTSMTVTQSLSVTIYVLSTSVSLTVTPAAISNTYSGPITLQVAGLADGETVTVQKYLVADGATVIDASATLWQQFNLTDGTCFGIDGVPDLNVPGDTDGLANGQITARLNFQADFSQAIDGQYLFKVSSPIGHFAPFTNAFVVTNFPYAQKFTGTVVNNGAPVPYASILLFPASGNSGDGLGNPIGGVVANNAGVYSLPAPAGLYLLVPFKTNYVASLAGAAGVVLSSGATLNTNLSLIAATRTISGQIVDAANPSQGLPGLLLSAQIKNGYLGVSTTDTNGFFTLGVTPNEWGISLPSAGLASLGYVGPQNKMAVSTVTGNASGVTIALPKATALFYGTVENSSGGPFVGEVAIYAEDNNNGLYQSDGYTDTNGDYVVAALGGLGANDPWNVSVDNGSSFPADNFSQPLLDQNGGTNLLAGVAVRADFKVIPAPYQITGNVKFNGTNLVNLSVYANSEDTNSYQAQATTDSSGNYTLLVGNGTWNVSVNCQGNNNSLQSILNSSFQCPCGISVTISNNNSSGNNIIVPTGGSGQIFGYLTNSSGGGISGVTINLQNQCSGQGYSTSTAGNGYYSITVPDGQYNANVDCGGLNSAGYQCLNSVNVTLVSGSVQQNFTAQSSGGGGSVTLFGYVEDSYGDPVGGVNVTASDGVGDNYSTTTTGSGYYGFNAGNGTWDVSVSCSGLNSLGFACVSDELTNIYQDTVELDFTVESGNSATPVAITTTGVPDALVGAVYSQQLSASGGQAPYAWSLDPGSLLLPQGILLSASGIISGPITTADIGTNYFLVDVTDNQGNTASQFFSLAIYPALTIAASSLPNGTVGTPYSAQVLVSGGRPVYLGNSPAGYDANFPSGSLPPGLIFSYGAITSTNEYFVISGTPTNSGTFSFTMGAYDADNNYVQANYSITIAAASVKITTTSLTNATVGVGYTNQLTGSGGTPPYTWTISVGSQPLPAPLTLATTGVLSGVPVASGTNTFIVRLADHNSLTATHTFTLVTNPKPRLGAVAKISGNKYQFLLTGAVGQNYTLQVSTNLHYNNWTTLLITNSTTTNSLLLIDPNATNQQRFYRVLIGP